jgi:polysaccharide biosynthesis protein PslG
MMRSRHTTPKHAWRPRHARSSRRAQRLLLAIGLLALLSLVLTTTLLVGAAGSDGRRSVDRPSAGRLYGREPARPPIAPAATLRTTTPRPTTTRRATTTTRATTTRPVSSPLDGLAVGVQFHGMWTDYTDAQRLAVLDKMAAAHLRWIRIDMTWAGFEERCRACVNQWYLNRANFLVEAARARGLRVLVTLWRTPAWANSGAGELVPPAEPAEFGRFAGWVAARFKGRVSAYEIWNEPDSRDFFAGDLEQYLALLRAAYPAIKLADPDARVVLGGPINNDTAWLAAAYRAGARPYFDVLATHPYMAPSDLPPETPDRNGTNIHLLAHVAAVRKLMVSRGDTDKPIWFTEFGWSTHPNSGGELAWMRGVTLEQQAEYTVRAIRFVRSNFPYVTTMIIYSDRNRATGNVQVDNYGILYRDLSEKPVYTALRAMLGG